MGGNLYYYGSSYALDEIGYSYGTNMVVTGFVELAAFIIMRSFDAK